MKQQSVKLWFGPAPWGSALDPEDEEFRPIQIPTPVGQKCLWCDELIQAGDSGELVAVGYGPPDAPKGRIQPQHRECSLLHSVGHEFGLCGCTNYEGLSRRQAALECDRRVQAAAQPISE